MPDEAPQEQSAPTNVIEALRRVMDELPGIAKARQSNPESGDRGIKYAYRGIEQITTECQPLFARYGVIFTPHVRAHEIVNITVNGNPWTDTILTIEYTVYGPGGADDCIKVGPLVGIGRDNSDKGANKAETQAFKYALIQTFCIADEKDDGDAATHVADAARPVPTPAQLARGTFGERVRSSSHRAAFKAWASTQGLPEAPAGFTDDQLAKAIEWMDNAEDAAANDAAAAATTQNRGGDATEPHTPAREPAAAPVVPDDGSRGLQAEDERGPYSG